MRHARDLHDRRRSCPFALVLKIAGATPADVARLTIYVVNYSPRDLEGIRLAGTEFLPARNPPAGIVPGVQSLPMEGLLIAVDATAVVRAMFQPRQRRVISRLRRSRGGSP